MKRTHLAVVGVLAVLAVGCTATPPVPEESAAAPGGPGAMQSEPRRDAAPRSVEAPPTLPGSEVVFRGSGSGSRDDWQTFELAVPQPADATVTLDWNSTGPSNLNVYLKTLDGRSDYDYANGPDTKPEIARSPLAAGRYMVAVKIKPGTGETHFTVSINLAGFSMDTPPTVPPTTAPAPAAPPPETPVSPDGPSFPGDAAPGFVRWGAAIGGNSDPARHESVTGAPIGLRRTYFAWSQRTGSMLNTARSDLRAGRLPWVSTKTPGWAEMASGNRDGEIDEMLRALDGLGGPVWLTVHHEPEGGGGNPGVDDPGGAPAWRAMQTKIRERMGVVGTTNIAFAPILMSWTFVPLSNRTPSDWWVDGIWDFAGIDHYVEKESLVPAGPSDSMWNAAHSFYSAKGLKVALGEWGNRGTDAAAAAEMSGFYDLAVASGRSARSQIIGFAYFDSNLNSPKGGWELAGEPLVRFRQLVTAPTSLRADRSSG